MQAEVKAEVEELKYLLKRLEKGINSGNLYDAILCAEGIADSINESLKPALERMHNSERDPFLYGKYGVIRLDDHSIDGWREELVRRITTATAVADIDDRFVEEANKYAERLWGREIVNLLKKNDYRLVSDFIIAEAKKGKDQKWKR